jgi:hypothetical protein
MLPIVIDFRQMEVCHKNWQTCPSVTSINTPFTLDNRCYLYRDFTASRSSAKPAKLPTLALISLTASCQRSRGGNQTVHLDLV